MKRFYKVFNSEECHFGFKYKTGLNIDPVPFNTNPYDTCCPGGLYFSDANNIMGFIASDMAYIREVEVPEGYETVHLASKTKYRAHALNLLEQHKLTDVKTWQWMIDQQIDINADDNYAIAWASSKGHLSVVKFLVEHAADVTDINNFAIELASENGHLSVVKYLVEHGARGIADNNEAIRWARENGHLSVLNFLVEHGADVTTGDNNDIRHTRESGLLSVVKYLIEKLTRRY